MCGLLSLASRCNPSVFCHALFLRDALSQDSPTSDLDLQDQILEARGALDVVGQAEQLLEQNKAANQIRSGAFAVEQKLPGKSSAAASFGLDAWAQQVSPAAELVLSPV